MDNSKLPINQLISKINSAANNNEPMRLSVDEVKLIATHFGDIVMIPVYDMNNFPVKQRDRGEDTDMNKNQ